MSYAIVETGGKQYKVQPGDIIYVEKLNVEENSEISLDRVIALSIDENLTLGTPYVEGAAVPATVLKNGRGKKIRVSTYKAKKNYHRTIGHRQPYTKLQIGDISAE